LTSGVEVGLRVAVGFGVLVDVGAGVDVLVAGGAVGVADAPSPQASVLKVNTITVNIMGILRSVFIQFPPQTKCYYSNILKKKITNSITTVLQYTASPAVFIAYLQCCRDIPD